jgi:hypothetical protein
MASIVILYNNFADSGIYSGGSWRNTLPLTNLQDPDIRHVARSNNALAASSQISLDLGQTRTIDGVAFGPANLSPGATWQFRLYSNAAHTTLVYDSGLQTVSGSVIDWTNTASWLEWEDPRFWVGNTNDADALPQYLFHIAPALQFAQYCLLTITDPSNLDGYVEIGRLLVGQAWRPSVNYFDNTITPVALTDMQESLGGKRDYWERGVRRKATYGFPNLPQAEILGDAFSMSLIAGISRHVFVIPNPDDNLYGPRRSFLATLAKASDLRQLIADRGTTAIDVEEVL